MTAAASGDGAGGAKDLDDFTVCIVGIGLMGGSLGMALRGRCRRVLGVARRPETAAEAVSVGAADAATTELGLAVPKADIVVLAAPVRTILRLIPDVASRMRPGAILTDLGSTKATISDALDRVRPDLEVVGGHPLCGRDSSGLAFASRGLFAGRAYVLTPLPRTGQRAIETMSLLASAIGARPVVMDAVRHDRLVAAISHTPYALAACLAALAGDEAAADSALWQLASSGFRDTSRLAASDVQMMEDILLTNRANVAALARRAAAWLEDLAGELGRGDEEDLHRRLEQARRAALTYRGVQPALEPQRAEHGTSGA